MRNHSQKRNLPLTFANYFIILTGILTILFGGFLQWLGMTQRQQTANFPAVPTAEVTGTVKNIHRPRTILGGRFVSDEDELRITLNEYKNTFELQEFRNGYDAFDLLWNAEENDSVTVTLTVDEEEWDNGNRFVSVYGISVNGETLFTKEDYLAQWEKDADGFPWMAGGAVLVGVVILLWGWFWREKPKWYSPFSRY